MRVNRFEESYERRRRLEGERALKELEAENERLRSRIMAMRGLIDQSKETTFCNCSTCNRMRKEGLV